MISIEAQTRISSAPMMESEIQEILNAASELSHEEREDEAELLINDALKKYPKNPDLLARLGIIQSRLHKDEEAEETLRAVLRIDPSHEDAASALGRLLDHSLRTEEAEGIFKQILESNPSSHCTLDDYCRLLLSENREEEALVLARTQIQKYPTDIDAYEALRYVLAILEDSLENRIIEPYSDFDITVQLVSNLAEQFETLEELHKSVDLQSLSEDVLCDLQEELVRIIREIGHTQQRMSRLRLLLPEDLDTRLTRAIQSSIRFT